MLIPVCVCVCVLTFMYTSSIFVGTFFIYPCIFDEALVELLVLTFDLGKYKP